MPDLDEINPHLALAYSESYVSDGDRAWDRFVRKLEQKLGRTVDGDEGDGFSLGSAYDYFAAGLTVEQYIEETREAAGAR